MSHNNDVTFFQNKYLSGLISAEYLVLKFLNRSEVEFGAGKKAPYLYFKQGDEELHLVSVGGVHVRHGNFGIYKPGNIIKYQGVDDTNRGFKLMSAVEPVMDLPSHFVAHLSTVGRSIRCHHNFGLNGEYPIVCMLDRDGPDLRSKIGHNTPCEVSIAYALGTEEGLPLVCVQVQQIL